VMQTDVKRAKMFALVAGWERSGLSRAEYAEQHGVSYGTLYYWCRQREEAKESLEVVAEELPSRPFVSLAAEPGGMVDAPGVVIIKLASDVSTHQLRIAC